MDFFDSINPARANYGPVSPRMLSFNRLFDRNLENSHIHDNSFDLEHNRHEESHEYLVKVLKPFIVRRAETVKIFTEPLVPYDI
jgi:hypothetical protein